MNKNQILCVLLSVIAAAGLGMCISWHGEIFTIANCVCMFVSAEMFVFLPLGLGKVGEEERVLFKAFILAVIGIETGILAGIPFWFLPLAATVLPGIYFLIHSWFFAKDLNFKELANNLFWLTVLSYTLFTFIKKGVEPAWYYFIGI